MAEEFILQEDGFQLILEDGSGNLLLEQVVIIPIGGGSGRLGRSVIGARSGRVVLGSQAGRVTLAGHSGRVKI